MVPVVPSPHPSIERAKGEIPNCSGELHDPVKPAFRRLGILPQQLRTSPLFVLTISHMNPDRHLTRPAANGGNDAPGSVQDAMS